MKSPNSTNVLYIRTYIYPLRCLQIDLQIDLSRLQPPSSLSANTVAYRLTPLPPTHTKGTLQAKTLQRHIPFPAWECATRLLPGISLEEGLGVHLSCPQVAPSEFACRCLSNFLCMHSISAFILSSLAGKAEWITTQSTTQRVCLQ